MRLSWLWAFAALALGCAKFSAAEGPTPTPDASADGGGEVAVERDVVVVADWPTLSALDPTNDSRAATLRITIVDTNDTSRRAVKKLAATERGPFTFEKLVTSSKVDAKIEIVGSDERLVGYGERRSWDLAADTKVPVLARARVLYFGSGDRDGNGSRNGQLRALSLAPQSLAEPGIDEPYAPLPSLEEPTGLHITREGRWLVQTGTSSAGGGAVAAFETGNHQRAKSVTLPFVPGPAAPLGDGHRLLVAPSAKSNGTVFAMVDLDTGTASTLASGLAGGALVVTAIAASPDGMHVAAVGEYRQGGNAESYLFLHHAGAERFQSRSVSDVLRYARGVRFTPDGTSLVVAGSNDANDWATGALVTFPAGVEGIGAPKRTVTLAAAKTRASSVILDPTGNFAFVTNETRYGVGACCGEMRIVDLAMGKEVFVSGYAGNAADFEIVSAVQLPYEPRRVLGGQSDPGNDVHGPIVELTGGAKPVKVTVSADGDIGSVDHMATPFGTSL